MDAVGFLCAVNSSGNVAPMWRVHVETHTNLVLPLKLRPHLPELCVCAGGGLDVIHDVDVDIAEDHTVPVTGGSRHVVHCGDTKSQIRLYDTAHHLDMAAALVFTW